MMDLNPKELSEETLNELEEMAAALLPANEIAILLQIANEHQVLFVEMCKNHKLSEIYRRYNLGRLTTKYELRKNIIKLAKAGSPAAEPLAIKFISEQNID